VLADPRRRNAEIAAQRDDWDVLLGTEMREQAALRHADLIRERPEGYTFETHLYVQEPRRPAASYFENLTLPGALPILGAAIVLFGAAILALLMPAARASRVDVLQAIRPE